MATGDVAKQLMREYKTLRQEIDSFAPGEITFEVADDVTCLSATLTPVDGFYRGGTFVFQLHFPDDYPFGIPSVECHTPIHHPNIDSCGDVCFNLLDSEWTDTLRVCDYLHGLLFLLKNPVVDDALNYNAQYAVEDMDTFACDVLKSLRGLTVGDIDFPVNLRAGFETENEDEEKEEEKEKKKEVEEEDADQLPPPPSPSTSGDGDATTLTRSLSAPNLTISLMESVPVPPMVPVTFSVRAETSWGEHVRVVGSHPALGLWDPHLAVPMTCSHVVSRQCVWITTRPVCLPSLYVVEFKFVVVDEAGNVVRWETEGANRVLVVPDAPQDVDCDMWAVVPPAPMGSPKSIHTPSRMFSFPMIV